MARLSLGTLAAGVFVVGTVSCTDRDLPVEPETPGPSAALTSERAQTGPPSGDVPTLKRFDVDVEASGTFRPGAPVTLRVRVTGLTDVTNAELRVALPEVSGAVASDWGDGFRYPPTGVRVGAVLTHIFDVARGASSEFTVPVEVPVEGYYHVVTTLRAPEGAPIVEGGRVALNTAVDESWLLITEAGGELTSTFEPERIPTGYLEKGGPFRSSRAAVSRRNPAEADAEPVPAGPSVDGGAAIGPTSEAGVHHEITYQIKYFDVDADSYLPLPHAYVVVSLCTYPFLFSHECEDFEPADYTFTDSNGYFSFLCDEDEYRVAVHTFRPTSFYVHYGDAYAEGDVDSDCGGSFEDIMVSTKAKIFRNLYATVDGTIDLFGDDRSFVDVYEDAENEPTNSYYDPDDDDIHILTDLVWDNPGAFITAHEYGHAFHEDALLWRYGMGKLPGSTLYRYGVGSSVRVFGGIRRLFRLGNAARS